jgi:polysaccharide deacetylase family protein (PEP-CTERM system associated)
MLNALSIDVEDWFHVELIRSRISGDEPERRVAWAVEPILSLLARYDVRATFFVVGDIMRHHPDLVERIRAAGHEIGCHGWSHRPLWSLAPERFAEELDTFDRDAAAVMPIQEIIGFRAPTFSIDERTTWAVDVLRSRGYLYDSSVFPARNYMYGVDGCPPHPYRPTSRELTTHHPEGDLLEYPMTVYRLGELAVPISGGFYLRAIPLPVLRGLLSRVNAGGNPFVIYLHPWETDIHTPRVKRLSLMSRFITYYNMGSTLKKLEALLGAYEFAPLREVLNLRNARRVVGERVS